ncbi:Mor transcription activator family protein [Crenothrix sp.]|uniref:Mor transcription activator family protein n=1 Tax=Crenothrix sp. TaxID=3100433 RepID=UPI00374DCCAA
METNTSPLPEHYPQQLIEFYDILFDELKTNANNPPAKLAFLLTERIKNHFRKSRIYIPEGREMKKNALDEQIFQRYNGRNINELVKEFEMSEPAIYKIIKKHRILTAERQKQKRGAIQ